MNFDYIEAVISLDKDKPSLDYLDYQACYNTGWEKYLYEGCKAVEVWLNPDTAMLKIKGSIPYFVEGHNFNSSHSAFKSGIDHLSNVLALDLHKAEMKKFEYGTILEIPFPVNDIFLSHLKIPGMKTKPFDYGIYFEDRVLKVKLYDANRNLKIKLNRQERERLTLNFGYNVHSNYLKIENHYKNPYNYFKQGIISLGDMLSPDFETICKHDLSEKYKSIMKTKSINLKNKKQLTSSTIPLIILKEYERLLPCSAEELIKQKIKSLPASIMTNEDKKSRRRQIKANFKKLYSEQLCQYDVSGILLNQLILSES
jgi:hypothetical protein